MMVLVERNSDEPVYEQIARQMRELVAKGELPPGSPLPTVRTLASDLGVNLNTVARAYWLLEEEGFIEIRDRSGAKALAPVRKSAADREHLFREQRKMLVRMRQAGISSAELLGFLEREIAALAAPQEQ